MKKHSLKLIFISFRLFTSGIIIGLIEKLLKILVNKGKLTSPLSVQLSLLQHKAFKNFRQLENIFLTLLSHHSAPKQ